MPRPKNPDPEILLHEQYSPKESEIVISEPSHYATVIA